MASRNAGEEQSEQPKVVQSAQKATYGLESSTCMVFPSQGHVSSCFKGVWGWWMVRESEDDEPNFSLRNSQGKSQGGNAVL